MFKKFLLKLANKIIDKYGIHYLGQSSIICMYDRLFEIRYVEFQDDFSRTNKNGSYINIDCVDINKRRD